MIERQSGPRLGIGARIAVAAALAAFVGIAILGVGILVVGGAAFESLMLEHGETTDAARSMFDASVGLVVLVAAILAGLSAIGVAMAVGRRLGAPLQHLGEAAGRVAGGDLDVRVVTGGPPEVATLGEAFNAMAAQLGEQERIRRDFIVGAAHELRTPLTNLTGYLEALRDGVVVADAEVYGSLLEEAGRLTRLAASLDTLADGDARTRPIEGRQLDIGAAVGTATALVAPAAERAGLRLEVDAPGGVVACADPDAVAQVLANLLSNAIRYTPTDGTIRVDVTAEPSGANDAPGGARVTIVNSGPGIPGEDLPRVFERFYRVEKSRDPARGGAGIGLAIVRQLVEAMGGRVGATSVPGLETVFWFMLPAAR